MRAGARRPAGRRRPPPACGPASAPARWDIPITSWPSHWLKLLPQYVNALFPPIAGERVGVEGWGGNGHLLEYQTHMQAPTYDVQFLRSEALRSSSSSSSRTRQIKECKIR